MSSSPPIVFLSGAGGGAPDVSIFKREADARVEVVSYPGWSRYIADGFSAEVLVSDLVQEIEARVPHGPIIIVGLSIGGHFGYASAIRLQARGREIAGLCAIDSFMIASSKPSAGWKSRALTEGLELLRRRRFGEFASFLRSKFWRSLVRVAEGRLLHFLHRLPFGPSLLSSFDPVLEKEISMRMLIKTAAPWIGSLDREPSPLDVPAALLRTARVSNDDAAWRRRCPNIKIFEIGGRHYNLFEPENVAALRQALDAVMRDWRPRQ